MGRNLNALLNSAVKERHEQSAAPRPPQEERAVDASDERAASEALPTGGSTGGSTGSGASGERSDDATPAPAASTSDVSTPAATASASGALDLSIVRVPSGGAGHGTDETAGTASRAVPAADAHVTRVMSPVPPGSVSTRDDDDPEPGDPPRPGDRLRMIGVERIRRGVFQPRRFFDQDALQELADSLTAQGMIQPVVVRPIGDVFELIAGERRWRAAQIAGLAEIPAIVREMEDRSVAAVSLIENIQREDLNPLEEAQALMRLCDEFGMTHAAVAESIGRSRAAVSNLMRLLELHDEVKAMVDRGELDMGHARALLRVPKVDQPALAVRVAKQGLTVRAVEKLIRTGADKTEPGDAPPAATALDPDVERLVERLSGVLGAPVAIRHKPGGAGRLEIRYGSLDELDGILAHIR